MPFRCIGADDCPRGVSTQGGMCATHLKQHPDDPASTEETVPDPRKRRVPATRRQVRRMRRVLDEHIRRLEKASFRTTKTGAMPPPSRGLLSMSIEASNALARLSQEERQLDTKDYGEGKSTSPAERDEISIAWLCREECPAETKRRAIEMLSESLGASLPT